MRTKEVEEPVKPVPDFPFHARRTPLAKTRTFLANRRSQLAYFRTSLSKGRTGLAVLRTGITLITFGTALYRIFGAGYLLIADAALILTGTAVAVEGFIRYLPVRKQIGLKVDCSYTEPSWGVRVLTVSNPGISPTFSRASSIEGAAEMRADWYNLAPVLRRRFLASDRTDMAEERATLACYRTKMARARTGLAFARTGVAFIGLGVAFLRQFRAGPWTYFDISLIAAGLMMAVEGFYWYLPGRRAGRQGGESVDKAFGKESIWDVTFPPVHKRPAIEDFFHDLPVKAGQAPGIWGTTGHALERTVLAERRNVMARLRTVMARSRTGMAFMRTGMSITAVGMGLLVYFGAGNIYWTVFDVFMVAAGLFFMADGLYWHIPAENTRKQFPYCFTDIEISMPDYGRPNKYWKKAVFSHDDI